MGYDQHAGGGWSGDVLVVDWEEVANEEHFNDIYIKKLKAKVVYPVKNGEQFRFLLAEGALKQPGPPVPRVRPRRAKRSATNEEDDEEIKDWADEDETSNQSSTQPGDEDNEAAEADPEGLVSPRDLELEDVTPIEADFWTLNQDVLIRHHRQPRLRLFDPGSIECPVPLKYLGIMRATITDLEDAVRRKIEDYWYPSPQVKKLSDDWTGKTVFTILRPTPPPGHKWIEGRLTRIQTPTRPDKIWLEIWRAMSQKQKRTAINKWNRESKRRNELRTQRGISDVPVGEIAEYNKVLSEARERLKTPPARLCQS